MEARGPSLRPAGKPRDVVRVELELGAAEKLLRLPGTEAQVLRPDLRELTVSTQTGKGQAGVGPARDDELDRFREALDEDSHRLVADRAPDLVPVLQDDDEGRRVDELVDEERDHALPDRARAGAQSC